MAAPATFSILSRSLDFKRRGESTGLASAVFYLWGRNWSSYRRIYSFKDRRL
ncbi:hypothetical protein Q5M85_16560 [Paraclostridium bifermentans]|nr:hypothetical protein [Paraclostridium bifermentans]